ASRSCDSRIASKAGIMYRDTRDITSLRGGAPMEGLEPAPQQGGVRSKVPLDLLSNLVAIHMDREVAFFAELNSRLRILVRQPAESAGGPNGCVGRCGADVL